MKVIGIQHASVNTHGTDLDELKRFYGEVIGMPLAPRPPIGVDGYWFEAGPGSQVHVIDAPPARSGVDPIGNHYCLVVDDLEAAHAELERAGVPCFRGGDQVFLTDPAGNTVELQQAR